MLMRNSPGRTPFGQRIAHGTMTFAIGIGLTASQINPVAFTYGYDKLRFPKPVFIGDTLRTRVTVKEKQEDPKRKGLGRVVEACEVLNQRDEVVLYCEHILLAEKRPGHLMGCTYFSEAGSCGKSP